MKGERHCTFRGGQFVEDVILQLLHLDLETVLLLNELFAKIGQVRPLFSYDEIEQLPSHITGSSRIAAML